MERKLTVLFSIVLFMQSFLCSAQVDSLMKNKKAWFAGVTLGGALAFGDDSYNVISDFKNANGIGSSIFLGREFSKIFSVRINARYQRLYSRVNLELLSLRDLFPDKYQDFFPRDGFYGYDCYGVQADAMFNLLNLLPNRMNNAFNFYLISGLGLNVVCNYSRYSEWWSWESGFLDVGWYDVDRRVHTMPMAMIGGIIDFKLCKFLNLDFQFDCSFTGDNLEGVVSGEFYDAYITYSIGLTTHF